MSFDGVFTHYMVQELKDNLETGRINKIYQVSNYELVFVIRAHQQTHKCLLSIHPIYSRIQLTDLTFRYPQEPPLFCMVLRKHLEGGIIRSITQKDNDRIIQMDVEYYDEIGDVNQKQLIIEVMGRHSNIILINKETQKIIDCIKHVSPFQNSYRTLQPGADYKFPPTSDKVSPFTATIDTFSNLQMDAPHLHKQLVATLEGVSPLFANELLARARTHTPLGLYEAKEKLFKQLKHGLNPTIIHTDKKSYYYLMPLTSIEGNQQSFSTLSHMLDRFYYRKDEQERIKQQTQDLEKFIKNELEKYRNKLINLNQDLEAAYQAEQYKLYGELILSNAYHIEQGMHIVTVENYYDNNNSIDIPLDPLLNAIDNSQKYYQKYQKAKKAIGHIEKQINLTHDEILYFETLTQQIETASLEDALEIRQELEDGGYLRRKKKRHKRKPTRLKYETYTIDGATLYVGKNNLQNDYLTFKHAHKSDYWMHVKDMPGSHVIIRAEQLTEPIIRTAAQLASYFSKGRLSSSVPVDYTLVKNVKKIPGAKPGFVTYDQQKTIYIDPDPSFIENLMNQQK